MNVRYDVTAVNMRNCRNMQQRNGIHIKESCSGWYLHDKSGWNGSLAIMTFHRRRSNVSKKDNFTLFIVDCLKCSVFWFLALFFPHLVISQGFSIPSEHHLEKWLVRWHAIEKTKNRKKLVLINWLCHNGAKVSAHFGFLVTNGKHSMICFRTASSTNLLISLYPS